jgi:hypothetical protein
MGTIPWERFLWPGMGVTGSVKIPAIVQQSDLTAVFFLESSHQLIAKPLRHISSPFLLCLLLRYEGNG